MVDGKKFECLQILHIFDLVTMGILSEIPNLWLLVVRCILTLVEPELYTNTMLRKSSRLKIGLVH